MTRGDIVVVATKGAYTGDEMTTPSPGAIAPRHDSTMQTLTSVVVRMPRFPVRQNHHARPPRANLLGERHPRRQRVLQLRIGKAEISTVGQAHLFARRIRLAQPGAAHTLRQQPGSSG